MYWTAVLTNAHCCQPRSDDTIINNLTVTIGAIRIPDPYTFGVKPDLRQNPGVHYEILENPVPFDPTTEEGQLYIPSGYRSFESDPEWDVCLVELDSAAANTRANIGGISTLFPYCPSPLAWAHQLCSRVLDPLREFLAHKTAVNAARIVRVMQRFCTC